MASLVNPEAEGEAILALQTAEVAVIKLGQDNNDRSRLGNAEGKVSIVVVGGPRDIKSGPSLRDTPFGTKQTSSFKGLVLAEEILIRYPEISVVAEPVIKLGEPLGRPFLRAVT